MRDFNKNSKKEKVSNKKLIFENMTGVVIYTMLKSK